MRKLDKRKLITIIVLSIAGSVIWEVPYIKYVYYDPLLEAYNLTNAQSGLLLSMYAIGCMIFYVPGGILADRFSAKKLVVGSLLGTAGLGYIYAFNHSFIVGLIVYFGLSVTTTLLFWSAVLKAVRIIGGEDQGTAYGFYYAAGNVVGLLAAVGYLAIYNAFSYDSVIAMRWVIVAMSTVTLVTGLLTQVLYRENEQDSEASDDDKIDLKNIVIVLKNKYFWIATAIMFIMYSFYTCQSYFTPYLTAQIGMEVTDSAAIAVVRGYALYLLCPIGGYIADKLLKSTLRFYGYGFIIIAILYSVVIFIPTGSSSKIIAVTISLISSAFVIILYGVMWSIMSEINVPVSFAATAIGIASIITYMPDLFLHTLFGSWLDIYGDKGGYFRIFTTLTMLGILAVLLSFYLARKVKNSITNIPDPSIPAEASHM